MQPHWNGALLLVITEGDNQLEVDLLGLTLPLPRVLLIKKEFVARWKEEILKGRLQLNMGLPS